MSVQIPPQAKIATALLIGLVAVNVVRPVPYLWAWLGFILLAAALSLPAAKAPRPRGEYGIAVISPFGARLLVWYLNGRTTLDSRRVVATSFKSAEDAAALSTRWDAVVSYEDSFPMVRRWLPATPLKIVMNRGSVLKESGIVVESDIPRASSPPDLLRFLPLDAFVPHPGSRRILVAILLCVAVVVGAFVAMTMLD